MCDNDEEKRHRPKNVLRRMMKQLSTSRDMTRMENGPTELVGNDGRGDNIPDAGETQDDDEVYYVI